MVRPNNSSENTELIDIIEMDDKIINDVHFAAQFNPYRFDELYKIELEKIREVDTSLLKYSEIFSTENKYYMMMECYGKGIEYQKMLVRDFIAMLTSYMQKRADEIGFCGEYDISCYYSRKSNNSIEKIFIQLSDKTAVLRKNLKNIRLYHMGIPKLTIVMYPEEINCITYRTNNPEIIAFQCLPNRFCIDTHYGSGIYVFKNVDDSIEGKLFLVVREADNFKDICQNLGPKLIRYLQEDGLERSLYNENYISFASIGLKTGDEILFRNMPTAVFLVNLGSAFHFPRNTGIQYIDEPESTYDIRSITTRLLGYLYNDETDIFEHWTYKGKTLRTIFEENKAKWIVPIEFSLDAEYYENNPQLKKNVEN